MHDLAVHATVLLEDWCGLVVPHYHLPRLEAELSSLSLDHLTKEELSDRFHRDSDLRSRILARVTIPETYFFRYIPHYRILRQLARERAGRGRPFRVLSAGCATGEEAWSAAAVLAAELGPEGETANAGFEVLGVDMVDRNLLRAVEGRYSSWSARGGLHGYDRFFRRTGKRWEVAPALRRRVQFKIANLLEIHLIPESYDVIFFRNVALYWQENTLETVLARLVEALRPDGFLLVGPNDPIPAAVDGLRRESALGVRLYRRPRPGEDDTATRPLPASPDRAPKAVRRPRPAASSPPTRRPAPARPAPHPATRLEPPAPPLLARVEALADRGDYEQALELIGDHRETSAEARMWRGILLLNLERPQEALASFRQCVYLETHNPIYRRWMAATYEVLGLGEEAEREYRNLEELELDE